MARRFYFTSDNHPDGENPCNDHIGNIRGARTIAQRVANELGEVVYINDCKTNNIEDCVYPDEATEAFDTEPTTEDTVPNKITTDNPNEQQLNDIKQGTEIKTLYDYLIFNDRRRKMKSTIFLQELSMLIERIKDFEDSAGYSNNQFDKIDFDENNPDEQQLYYELRSIMYKLVDVRKSLDELTTPVAYESFLYKNKFGKYEDSHGNYYSCGNTIEYLRESDYEDEPSCWCISRVEHDSEDYYIVGYKNHKIDEVLTRVRKEDI